MLTHIRHRFFSFRFLFITHCLVILTACTLDDSLKGQFGIVDSEVPTLDITSPDSDSMITYWNQTSFSVVGNCFLVGKSIRVQAHGVNSEDVLCQSNKTFSAELDFANPGVVDGMVTITAAYANVPAIAKQDSVSLMKRTYPQIVVTPASSVSEGSALQFLVTFDHVASAPFTFEWSTQDGTALSADSDYTPVTSEVFTVPANVLGVTLAVNTTADAYYEFDETVSVVVANPSLSYVSVASASGTISNNDLAPSLLVYDANGSEGSNLAFVVSLNALSKVPVSFNFVTIDGSASNMNDYSQTSGATQIAALQSLVTLSVPTTPDTRYELDETFVLTISSVQHALINSPGTDDLAVGTILNDDSLPNLFVSDDSKNEGLNLVFTVTLDRVTEVTAVFDWQSLTSGSATSGSDYTAGAGRFTLPVGVSVGALTIVTTGDATLETDETMFVSLTPVSAVAVATAGTDDVGQGTILNDDAAPLLFINDLTINEGETSSLMVSLSQLSGLDAVFSWRTFDGSALDGNGDYTSVALATVTIPAGSLTSGLVSFAALDDNLDEDSETASVSLTAVSGVAAGDLLSQITINDINPAPLVFVDDVALTEPNTVPFVVSLSQVSGKNIWFHFSSVDTGSAGGGGVDFNNFSSSRTIAAGQLGITITGLVNAVDDLISESIETYQITLTSLNNVGVGRTGSQVEITDNDVPPSIFILGDAKPEGTNLEFVVTLSGLTAAPVTFDFQTFNGTAVSASDYTAQNRSYTISAGSLALTIPVLTGIDSTFELDESFTVTISNVSSNATITSPGVDNAATGTIQNNDSSPLLFVSDASFNEDETGQFAVSLSATSELPVIFTWVTDDDGLAQEGVDYTAASGQGTIPVGALYFTIPVAALPADTLDEPLEDFSLDLAIVSFAGAGRLSAVGEIIDNDGAPNLYITDLNISEGNAGWMVVSLAAISGLPVSFDYQSYNTGTAVAGADYTGLSSTRLTILPGLLTISFQVTTLEDTVFETDEYFDVSLSNITNAGMGDISGLVTIEEDDAQPILAIYDVSEVEGTTLAFKVSLSVASDVASTFSWVSYDNTATTADSDYSSTTGSGTIAAGSLQYFINLISTHDTKLENDEILFVSLSGLGNVSVASVAALRATGTITNNDSSPLIYIDDLSLNEGQTQPVSISLSEVSGLETMFTWNTSNGVPVTLSAAAGSDYFGVTSQVVTIPAETRTIAINATAYADALDEYNENYIISLSSLINASAGDIEGIITIQDQNAEPALFISDLTLDEGDGGVIAVSLDQVSGRDLWFTYQTANGTATAGDYSSIASTTVTIPAGTLTVGISLSTTEDVISEGDETFYVSITSATYASIVDDTGLVTITDDDGAVYLYLLGDSKVEGSDLVFTASLSGISAFNVSYDFNTADGTALVADSDYSSSSGSGVIPAGQSVRTITIASGNDTKFENDESFTVSLSNVLGASVSIVGTHDVATGTIQNNDTAPLLYIDDLSFNEGVTGTFSVSLSQLSGLPVVFTWATYDGTALVANSDYSGVATTTVTIAPETLTISNVQVEALADSLDENSETFSITLAVLSGAGTGDLASVGTIQDQNVPPDLFIADASELEGEVLGFVVSLSVVSGLDVVFNYQSYNGTATTGDSDYTAISGTATIAALSSQITISLNTTEDTKLENDETLNVSLSSVVNATVVSVGTDDVGLGTIQNDDAAPQLFISSPTVNEGGTLVFQFSISEISALDVAFSYQTYNGTALVADSDYNAVSGGHTIGSGSLNYSISVVSNEDTKLENAEDFTLSLANLTGATVASGGQIATGTINNDDVAPFIFINDLSYNEGTTGSHVVSLSEVSGLPAVYSFTVYNIETIGADYTILSNAQITIAAETLTSQVQIHALTDGLDEFNETYRVSLTAIQDLQAGDLEAVGTIQDQDAEVQIFIQDVTKVEPSTSPHVVSLSQISGKDIVFNLSSVATGSATNNSDFSQIASNSITIPAGSISHSFNIIILNDALFEGDETFNLTLTSIANAQVGRSGAVVTIADDDGLPQLTVYPSSGNEGDTIYLTASLSEVSGLPVTFDWRTFDIANQAVAGSDYTAQGLTTYTLTAGQLTIALPVAALTDAPLDENNETFTVSISNAGNATIVGATAIGTILDIDTEPQVFVADASAVNEGQTLEFTVSLSKISGREVIVNYQTLDGTATSASSDYTSIASTPITFPAGTGTLAVNVVALTDALNEPNETVQVTLTGLTNVTAGDVVATGTINDINADPFIYISDISVTEEQTAQLTVSLNTPSAIPVVFTWSTLDGSATDAAGDYDTATSTMTIAAFATQVTIALPTLDDGLNEATENFFATLSAISDAQNGDVLGQIDILDNDPQPGIYVSDASAVIEGGTSLFTISLSYASGQDVSFDYRTLNDTAVSPDDYMSIALTRATIPAGQTTFAVLVATIDDMKDDSADSEYFFVTISSPNLATISVASGTGEITDNDNAPHIFISDASGSEGQTIAFLVTLSGESENDIDFDLETVNDTAIANGDYASQTISGVQIPAGSLSYTLSVVLNNDNIYEASESFSVSITSTTASNGDLSGVGSITDTTGIPSLYISDASAVTEGGTSQFIVTLTHLADTDITFNWSTVDGTARDQNTDNDFTGINTQNRTISALSSSVTLSVVTVDDAILEAQENYQVTVFGGSANVSIADGSGTASIDDNEAALNIFIVGDSKAEGTDLVFTVSISGTSAFNVTYSFNPFDGTATQGDGDFTITGGTNVINAGSTSQAITVVTGNDTKLEANEAFTLSLSNIVGATVANTGTDDVATGTIQNNDSSPLIYVDDLAINEAETLPLMVSLSQVSGLDAIFLWQTFDQTALQATGDYTAVAATQVTIPAGALTIGLVTFRALDDNLDENAETALVSLSGFSNVSIAAPGVDDLAQVTINDINSAPLIFIPDIALTEPDTIDFIVSLSQVSGKDVWFGFSSNDTGSASGGGIDYNDISQSNITIGAGLQVITLSGANAVDDLISEGTETYQITLSSINNAGIGKIGSTVTITDNEAMPYLVIYGDSEDEGTAINFVASLSGLSAGAVSFDFDTYSGTAISGTDFTANSSRYTIGAGSLQVTVAVNTTHDVLYELDEAFSVTISNITGSASISISSATGTILNNDTAPSLFIEDLTFGEETTGEFIVSISAVSGLNSVFNWQTFGNLDATEGTDYTATNGQMTIAAGSTVGTIPVVALPSDTLDENNEQFALSLAINSGVLAGDLSSIGTITDNDGAPNLFIDDLTITEGNTGSLMISLSAVSGLDVTFNINSFDESANQPGDYQSISRSLTIAAGQLTLSSQVITEEDANFEGNETFKVSISNNTNAGLGVTQNQVTITDDDPMPVLVIYDVSGAEGTTLNFVVSLNVPSDLESTFTWQSYNNTATVTDFDYTATNGTGTIAAGSLQLTIPVVSTPDTKLENDETMYVSLSGLGNVSVVAAANLRATGTITNNDGSPLIYINDLSLNEGQTLPVAISLSEVSGLETVFTWNTYNGVPATLSAAAGSDYMAVVNQVVTIPAETRTIAINATAYGDSLDEYDENYIISLSSLVNATAGDIESIITIQDQNATPAIFIADININEGATGVMTVSLDAASGRDVVFNYQTLDNAATSADYTSISTTTTTIPQGTVTFGIPLITTQDAISEGNHSFFVSLSAAQNASISDNLGIATILDDDTSNLYISDAGPVTEGQTLQFVVSLSLPSASDVTFSWRTFDQTARQELGDYSGSTIPLASTISAGSSQVTISVATADLAYVDGPETLMVSLSNLSGNATPADLTAIGTINDNDSLSVPLVFAVESLYNVLILSEDLSTFKYIDLEKYHSGSHFDGVLYCNGKWLITNDGDTVNLLTSDFVNFTNVTISGLATSGIKNTVCHENRMIVGNGTDGLYYSDNGTTWTQSSSSTYGIGTRHTSKLLSYRGRVYVAKTSFEVDYSTDDGASFVTTITLSNPGGQDGALKGGVYADGDRIVVLSELDESDNYYTDDNFATVTNFNPSLSSGDPTGIMLNGRLHVGTENTMSAFFWSDDMSTFTETTRINSGVQRRISLIRDQIWYHNQNDHEISRSTNYGLSNSFALYPATAFTSRKYFEYGAPEIDPGVMTFAETLNQPTSSVATSGVITVSPSMTVYQPVLASNGAEVNVNSTGWIAGWGVASITGGQTLQLRMTTASVPDKEKTTTLRIGSQRTEWTTRTLNQVDLTISDAGPVNEGQTLQFVVSLSAPAPSNVTFNWRTYDGTASATAPTDHPNGDYTAQTTQLTRTIGTGSSQVTIAVVTRTDLFVENTETMTVSLSSLSGNANGVDLIGTGSITSPNAHSANPLWVGINTFRNVLMSSADGTNFVYQSVLPLFSEGISNYGRIGFCNGKWVLISSTGRLASTTDLVNYNMADPSSGSLRASQIHCHNNTWYVTDQGGYTKLLRSTDGNTWASVTIPQITFDTIGIASSRGKLYVTGNRASDSLVMSSSDGLNFTIAATIPYQWSRVLADSGNIAVFSDGSGSLSSYSTQNEFLTTQSFTIPNSSSGFANIWSEFVGGRLLISMEAPLARVYYTDNLGSSFSTITGGHVGESAAFGNGIIKGFVNWGAILDSTNLGTSFLQVGSVPNAARGGFVYGNPGLDPDLFVFPDLTSQALNTQVESALVTITGMTAYQNVYASNGAEVQVNGGSYVAGWGAASITSGQTLRLRMTTANAANTSKTSTVRIGPQKTDWTTRTGSGIVNLFISDAGPVNEGQTLQFLVTLTSAPAANVTFSWRTFNGTAQSTHNGLSVGDYTPQSTARLVTITAGATGMTIPVTTLQDNYIEPNENLLVSLSGISANATFGDFLGTGSITSLDAPPTHVRWVLRSNQWSNKQFFAISGDGANFKYIDLEDYMPITVHNSPQSTAVFCNGHWYVGVEGNVLRTANFVSFTQHNMDPYLGMYTAVAVKCLNGVLYAHRDWPATNPRIARSVDGLTWGSVTITGFNTTMDLTESQGVILAYSEENNAIAKSTDNGLSFGGIVTIAAGAMGGALRSDNGRVLVLRTPSNQTSAFSDNNFTSFSGFTYPSGSPDIRGTTYLDGRLFIYQWGARYYTDNLTSYTSVGSVGGAIRFANGKIHSFSNSIRESTDRGASFTVVGSLPTDFESAFYGGEDIEPDHFTIAQQLTAPVSSTITSGVITISGMTTPQGVYAGNGVEARVNGGSWVSGWGGATVTGGNTLELRMVTPATLDTLKVSTLRLGSIQRDWVVRTTNQVNMFVSDASVSEGGTLSFVVSISSTTGSAVTFNWQTLDNTATTANSDYTAISRASTIAAGALQVTLSVVTTPDINYESTETLFVSLSSPSANATLIDAIGLGTITDSGCDATGWCQVAYLKAANADASDWFGYSLAIHRNTIAVAGFCDDSNQNFITNGSSASSDNSLSNSGAVYVYTRSNGTWAQQAYIKPSNPSSNDLFGVSVDLDHDTLIVGAYGESSNQTFVTNGSSAPTDNLSTYSGAAYIFGKTGGTWVQQAFLKASNNTSFDRFGSSVAIRGDIAAVGAEREDSNQTFITNGNGASSNESSADSGAVYIFGRINGTWVQQAYLKPSNTEAGDYFGSERNLSLDRDTLAVAAEWEDSNQTFVTNGSSSSSNNTNTDSGAVYVFGRTNGTWVQQAYLKSSNSNSYDQFGRGVSVHGDTIAVGAIAEDSNQTSVTNGNNASSDNSNANSGAVYLFGRVNSTWVQQAYLKASNNNAGDQFGYSVALSGDRIVVGASGEDSNQTIVTNGGSASADNTLSSAGAAYVFGRVNGTWVQQAYLKASNIDSSDNFGIQVAMDGDTIVVGSYESSNQQTVSNGINQASSNNSSANSGAAYVFVNRGGATPVIRQAFTQSDPATSLPISWDIEFSKEISAGTFTTADISLHASSTASGITWNLINSGDNRNYTLQATAVSSAGMIKPVINAGTITDIDGFSNFANSASFDNEVTYSIQPINMFITDAFANEGGQLVFAVYLDQVAPQNVAFSYATYDDYGGSDPFYVPASGTMTIAAGSQAVQIMISSIDNLDTDPANFLYVSLSGVSPNANLIDDIGLGVILDNDSSNRMLSVSDAYAIEGDALQFIVSIDQPATAPVTFAWQTNPGTAVETADYTGVSSQEGTIGAGQRQVTISVPTTENGTSETTEYMTVEVAAISGAIDLDIIGIGVIEDDDTAPVVTLSVLDSAVTPEGFIAEFTVTLTSPAPNNMTLIWSTTNGSATTGVDFVGQTFATQTIPQGARSARINVNTIFDEVSEGNETFSVVIHSANDAVIGDGVGAGVISNQLPLKLTYPDQMYQPIGYKLKVQGACASAHGNVNVEVTDTTQSVTLSAACTSDAFLEYINVSSLNVGAAYVYIKQKLANGVEVSQGRPLLKPSASCNVQADRQKTFAQGLAGGAGTQANPYVVCTANQLNEVRNATNTFIKLGNDIYFDHGDSNGNFVINESDSDIDYRSGSGWLPIPVGKVDGFDGQRFSIVKLTIARSTTNDVGLLGEINSNISYLKSVRFVESSVSGQNRVGSLFGSNQNIDGFASLYDIECLNCSVQASASFAGLVGGHFYANAVVSQVRAKGTVTGSGTSDRIGGLFGYAGFSQIHAASFEGSLSGRDCIGGISCGVSRLINSHGNVSITGRNQLGGLVGGDIPLMESGLVLKSIAEGTVVGTGTDIGCIMGRNNSGGGLSGSGVLNSVALCSHIQGSTGLNRVGRIMGHNVNAGGAFFGNNYYASEMTCTNGGGGGCNTSHSVSSASRASLQLSNHAVYDVWDFDGDTTDGQSELWMERTGASPALYHQTGEWRGYQSPLTGSGTDADPYQVATSADLLEISSHPFYQTASFSLTADINMSSQPSFKGLFREVPFTGRFDGGGFEISGISITESTVTLGTPVGFFGTAFYDAEVMNLKLSLRDVRGYKSVGGLVGLWLSGAKAQMIHISGATVTAGYEEAGGVVGVMGIGTMEEIEVHSAVSCGSGGFCGGFVGHLTYVASATNSYSTGSVSSTGWATGGFAGRGLGNISNSYTTSNVTSTSTSVGGIIGQSVYDNLSGVFASNSVQGNSAGSDVGRISGSGGDAASNYYFSGKTCTNTGGGGCNTTGISQATESYFYNPANAPLSSWNFTTIWESNSPATYPTLRRTPK